MPSRCSSTSTGAASPCGWVSVGSCGGRRGALSSTGRKGVRHVWSWLSGTADHSRHRLDSVRRQPASGARALARLEREGVQEGRHRSPEGRDHGRRQEGRGEEGVAHVIGVDIGGTHIRVGAVGTDGRLLTHTEMATDAGRGPEAVVAALRPLIANFTTSSDPPLALGVACAGQIDPVTGAVIYAPNLGWRDVPLAARLKEAFRIPVVVENDVRAAAWGEFVSGVAGRGRSLVAIFVGTGVGSGAVLDGTLWRGAGNAA